MLLKEGRGFAIDVDGRSDIRYIIKKDLNTESYVKHWNIPVLNIVRQSKLNYYLSRCMYIGHHAPLLSDVEWMELNIVMMNNVATNNPPLSFEELLADLEINYAQYGISIEMARTLQERFGMDSTGDISIDFLEWWEAFRHSSDRDVNGLFNMFYLHSHQE